MYRDQILNIFREFEKEESRGSWIEAFADKDSLNYKLYQEKKSSYVNRGLYNSYIGGVTCWTVWKEVL